MKDFFLLCLILFSGQGFTFARGPYSNLLLLVSCLFIFAKYLFRPSKELLRTIIVWFIYIAVAYISVHFFNKVFWFDFFSYFIIIYSLWMYYREDLIPKCEKILYKLCCITLFFYAWECIHKPSLMAVLSPFNVGSPFGFINVIVYNLNPHAPTRMFFTSNCGFTYEPGPFAGFTTIGLILASILPLERKVRKKHLIVFGLCLLSTQSSTGYIQGLTVLLWYVLTQVEKNKKRLLIPVVVVLVVYLVFNVSVLYEKIEYEYMAMERFDELIEQSQQSHTNISFGRFTSFRADWETFKQYPIFGINGNPSLHYLASFSNSNAEYASISGLGKIFAIYGLFGVVFFLLGLVRTTKMLRAIYNVKGAWILPTLVLTEGFSFSIIYTPFYSIFFVSAFLINSNYLITRSRTNDNNII